MTYVRSNFAENRILLYSRNEIIKFAFNENDVDNIIIIVAFVIIVLVGKLCGTRMDFDIFSGVEFYGLLTIGKNVTISRYFVEKFQGAFFSVRLPLI